MTGEAVLQEILLGRLLVIGAVFAALVVLVILVAWILRTGRR